LFGIVNARPEYIGKVLKDLEHWMQEHEYESIEQMKGSLSHKSIANPSAYERANYMKRLTVISFSLRNRILFRGVYGKRIE